MKLLVFGKTGQVATELALHGAGEFLARDQADLNNPEACARIIANCDADAIVNAAAYTAVDKAEEQRGIANRINGASPAAMARAAAARKIPFLHISTDYVFDGSGKNPWREQDNPNPQNVYGHSKLAGEQGVIKSGGQFAILRTSWVFSAHGQNFVKTMLRLAQNRTELSVVNDQFGGPTAASDIAKALIVMAKTMIKNPNISGIYHFSGQPVVNWQHFAKTIFETAGKSVNVTGIPTDQYPTPAKRPLNSQLDCSKISTVFGIPPPDWQQALHEIIPKLKAKK